MSVKTKAYPRRADGIGARAVVVTEKNASSVAEWLRGAKESIIWGINKKKDTLEKPVIRVRTHKGIRVAKVGDTIVKYGTYADKTSEWPRYEVVKG